MGLQLETMAAKMSEKEQAECKEAFDLFDMDGGGTIDLAELGTAMEALDFKEFLMMMSNKVSDKDAKDDMIKAFKLFDTEGSGKVSFKNLKAVAAELGESMTDADLQGMMDEADTDGDGEINESEFLAVMKAVNLY